jgi:hypothetical protein
MSSRCRACSFGHPNECENPSHCNKELTLNTRYRKRPVVIDAFHFTGDFAELDGWLDSLGYGTDDGPALHEQGGVVLIETLEGDMRAGVDDWIIRGVKGEFYPCRSDIFEATYERVAGDEQPDPVSEVRGDEAP